MYINYCSYFIFCSKHFAIFLNKRKIFYVYFALFLMGFNLVFTKINLFYLVSTIFYVIIKIEISNF